MQRAGGSLGLPNDTGTTGSSGGRAVRPADCSGAFEVSQPL